MFGSVKIFKSVAFTFLTFAIIAFLSQAALAETDIYIEEGDDPVDTFSMPVYLSNDDPLFEFDAFSIKIKYDTIWETHCDTTVLAFVVASPGNLLTDNGWQEFDFQEISNGVVEISASAGDGNDLSIVPYQQIAEITFYVTVTDTLDVPFLHVNFCWQDCGDNLFENSASNTAYIEGGVYHCVHDYGPIESDSLPSIYGIPDSCLTQITGYDSVNTIIGFHGDVTAPAVDYLPFGDLDFDGYPFQPGDYLLFYQYFHYGSSVFDVNIEGQVAQSDINSDGKFLTVADLISMYPNMICNVAVNNEYLKNDDRGEMLFVQDVYNKKIYCQYDDTSLSDIKIYFNQSVEILEYNGNIHRVPLRPEDMELVWLIPFNFQVPCGIVNGWQFTYTGDAIIDSISGTNFAIIESAGCGDANHDLNINISDAVLIINHVFLGASDPHMQYFSDTNCDSAVNISDAVRLINYIFISGDAPCDTNGDGNPDC